MLSEEEFRSLIGLGTETKNVDFKLTLLWQKGKEDKAAQDDKLELIRDILAMANTRDGGKIVLGVKDRTFEFVGLSNESFESIDQTQVNDFLHRYTDPQYTCHVHKTIIDGKKVVVIVAPEFTADPIICKRDAHSSVDSAVQILRAGEVYVRTEKATSETIPSVVEMRELLGRAIQKKGDELLASIRALFLGSPVEATDTSEEQFKVETEDAKIFFSESLPIGTDKGYWDVESYPLEFQAEQIASHSEIQKLLQDNTVSIRGWNFPHTDQEKHSNFGKGRQSVTIWQWVYEAYRAYLSAHFKWRRVFREDLMEVAAKYDAKCVLSFVGVIYSVTEYFIFFERFYGSIIPDGSIRYRIALHGVKGRKLISTDWFVDLYGSYAAQEDSIVIEGTVGVVELRASVRQQAANVIKKIFILFNWNDITDKIIASWQERFISGKG
jgi:hypothetical protein